MFRRLAEKMLARRGVEVPAEPEAVTQLVAVDLAHIDGAAELELLLISVSAADVQRALDGWVWIGLQGLTAVAVSAFGEIFFRVPDGRIVHLDTIRGQLTPVSESLPSFAARLQEPELREELLLQTMVIEARERGLLLDSGECYDFMVAPIVGGEMSPTTVHKLSFVVKVHLAGQLHEQVKDMPPGRKISGFSITE